MNRARITSPHARLLSVAMSQYGVQEWVGIEHNPEVMKFFHDIGFTWVKDDETAWCAAFVNWVLWSAGYPGTNKLNARSFLDIGKTVDLGNAQTGDIVVLWRGEPLGPYGHVGFLVSHDEHYISILGGNQGNQISIAKYHVNRLLSVRRLEPLPFSSADEPNKEEAPAISVMNSKKRVYLSLTKERDYQDDRRDDIRGNSDKLLMPDTMKSADHWLIYMEEHINRGKAACYALNDLLAMSHIRKATALGVAAMQNNMYPERE